MHEYQFSNPDDVCLWLVDQALSARNMDSYIGDKISSFLQEAGFHGIKDINYNVPIGKCASLSLFLSVDPHPFLFSQDGAGR